MYPLASALAIIIGIFLFVLAGKTDAKKSTNISIKIIGFIMVIGGLVMLYFVLSGKLVLPLSKDYQEDNTSEAEISVIQGEESLQAEMPEEPSTGEMRQAEEAIINEDETQENNTEPIITEMDWSDYFDGINGAAVIYDPVDNCYQIYNQELALTRHSPCSTFKIISSLVALENGIIEPSDSTRTWSGEIFWNEEWNRNIDFFDAFHASCVWYFREVIDEIGKDMIQEELNRLKYGNCDISDWEGHLNTNNNNPVLTGFWIESSLLISPKEQAEVMERIFGDHTDYSKETLGQLKQVMLLSEQNEGDILIYGKTGMGMSYGIVVDSWYTGFADIADRRIYFCVYLGETDTKDVSSAKAREIAVELVCEYETEQGASEITYTDQDGTVYVVAFLKNMTENGITVDVIEYVTDDNAERMSELGLTERDMPDGYYIYNPEQETVIWELNEQTVYTFIDWNRDFTDPDEPREYTTMDAEEFRRYIETYDDATPGMPFFFQVEDGVVKMIREKFFA